MNNVILYALLATLGTWAVTALGAATVIFFKNGKARTFDLMLGFAAGVMIAASFWSLLQPAIERAEERMGNAAPFAVTLGFLCGAIFMWGSDKLVRRMRKGVLLRKEGEDPLNRIILMVLAVTLHNIPEGLAVGVAFGALHGGNATAEALMGALSVAIGIGLQNFPEGAAVSLPLRREGYTRKKSFLIGQASGMVEPIAGVIGALSVLHMQAILPFALSFAAGTMILVAVHELIPECRRETSNPSYTATAGVVLGFAVMMLLDVALG